MKTLVPLPTRDPSMRVYRLPGTASGRPVTIHDGIRRAMAIQARQTAAARAGGIAVDGLAAG
jgi:hypothetical protein